MIRRKIEPPRGVLKTAVVEPSRYQHARYHPSPELEAFVEHYWSVQWDLRGLPPEQAETLPHPSVHLIFERPAGGRIAGVARGKFSRALEGKGGAIAVKFRPGGFYPFVNHAISTLTDRVVSVADVFGVAGESLERNVMAVETDAARIVIIEAFLRSRNAELDPQAARIADIVYAVAADRDILRVDDLVARYDLSVRALQRLFAKYVGVAPKWVIQRYRLHEAAEQLAGSAPVSQSQLALRLGYSDQAHFVRDFKAIVGTSPAAYARLARQR
jgi:AraC-like DNA-binding protein